MHCNHSINLSIPQSLNPSNPSFIHHRSAQRPHSFNFDFDDITRLHRSHARRRASGDQIAWKQCHDPRDEADYSIERKDEIAGVALLPRLAIQVSFYIYPRPRIQLVAGDRADGAEGVEALGSGPRV